MKDDTIITVTIQADDPPPKGASDWQRLAAMSDNEALVGAEGDLDAPPLGPAELARMRRVSPVKHLRQSLGLSQSEFSLNYRLPPELVDAWENHRTPLDPVARALLLAIERDPETLRRLLIAAE